MPVVPDRSHRGLALLALHLTISDEPVSRARERLDEALGRELAAKLVVALRPGHGGRRAA